ncbi:MAG: DUF433 domain-containing protein [Umezawaea sp.]
MFPADLTSVMTGASVHQLAGWRATGLLVPEISARPVLYSFRDVVALRTVMKLRTEATLQRVRKAFARLPEFELTKHPSEYSFGTDGKTISAVDADGVGIDLVRYPGQYEAVTLAEIFRPFTTKSGREVVDFLAPRHHLRVDGARMGGWPTIAGTRVAYDTISELMADGRLTAEDVHYYYPSVPVAAVPDAVEFAGLVAEARGRTA